MTAELPCCQGMPQHTYGEDCLHHREEPFDVSTERGIEALARKIVDDWHESGGVPPPGATRIRLEPGERILGQEDIRRLLGEDET